MKKFLTMGMIVVMLASGMTGCGKASSEYLLDEKYSDYVKLCDYKGVEATKVNFTITDEQVKEQIDMDLYDNATYDPITDRGVQKGDYVNVDYTASLDGKESDDYSGEDEDAMIGEGFLFPEMEEALVGMKPGEEKELEAALTEDFAVSDEDVGKKVKVKVTLNEISEENVPEYNEDFVKECTEYDTMEKYEESIKKELTDSAEEEYKAVSVDEIMAFLVDNSKFNGYPQELYDSCKENYDSSNEYYASMYGMELDEYLDMFGLDEETQKQEILDSVNYELVVGAIAQAEGIDCTEEEVKKFIKESYAEYGYASEEEFSEDYTDEEIGYEMLYEKVMDFLYDNASFKEISEEEYLKQQEEEEAAQEDMEEDSEEEDSEEEESGSQEEEGEEPEIEIEGSEEIDVDSSAVSE